MAANAEKSKAREARTGEGSHDIVVTAKAPPNKPEVQAVPLTDLQRRDAIAVTAYYLAEQRGFEPGHELEDWCAAETQIDTTTPAR